MPIGAHVMRSERRIIERLRDAHATQPHLAVPLGDLRHLERKRLQHLLRNEIVQKVEPDRYYVNESAWEDHLSRQRRIGLAIAFIMLVMFVFALAASRR